MFCKECEHILTSWTFGISREMLAVRTYVWPAAALLQELVGPAQSEAGIKIEFLERAKGDDGSSKIQTLIDLLKAQEEANVGTLPKESLSSFLASSESMNVE